MLVFLRVVWYSPNGWVIWIKPEIQIHINLGSGASSYVICHEIKITRTGNKITKIGLILLSTGCHMEKNHIFLLCIFATVSERK